ncbi:MAG: hypothetical protein OXH34_01720 [Bacteroidetes bacterium]|nr:hypothetical protein [Bacteroidota bacterium]
MKFRTPIGDVIMGGVIPRGQERLGHAGENCSQSWMYVDVERIEKSDDEIVDSAKDSRTKALHQLIIELFDRVQAVERNLEVAHVNIEGHRSAHQTIHEEHSKRMDALEKCCTQSKDFTGDPPRETEEPGMEVHHYDGPEKINLMQLLVEVGLVVTHRIAMQRIIDEEVSIDRVIVKNDGPAHGPVYEMYKMDPFVLRLKGKKPVRVIPHGPKNEEDA